MAGPDDELAHTATAQPSAPARPADELGDKLGRYKLERALGEGGMGIVHAAFDPDLERRVALKVLRTVDADDQSRQRLLREARAMARLTHENVVAVYEVGSAGGRDYVAMELVEGQSLDQWLKATDRASHEIIAAFLAAGRGLAAAHAAGLVHRDFKPHNVLRRNDGRIAVTDFGLARGVETVSALDVTVDIKHASATPSSLSGLTATGSVLGTPAYMAPEQWSGGTVGPAADQFAFCVALWEALTGERPFKGPTLDQLKEQVKHGGAALDSSKLPRRLRAPLARGLDPDPDKRYPNMNALLAALIRAERRPGVALAIAAAAVVAAATLFAVFRGGSAGPSCEPPAVDPAVVWPADSAKVLAAAGRGELVEPFERDINAWRAQRAGACLAPTEQRVAQLTCLDSVLARLDAVHRATAQVTGPVTADAVARWLVDPAVCLHGTPPRLLLHSSPDVIKALGYALDASRETPVVKDSEVSELAGKVEPCARAIALHAQRDVTKDAARRKSLAADEITAAETCGDDRLRADALLADIQYEYEVPRVGPRGQAAILKAKTAVDRVAQPDLAAELELYRADAATEAHHYDEAFAAVDAAIAGFGARGRTRGQLRSVLVGAKLHSLRATRADIDTVRGQIAKWKPVAEKLHDDHMIRSLTAVDAYCRWFDGDLEAHDDIMRAWHPEPPEGPTQRITGAVLGRDGKPVAGATVVASQIVFFDPKGPLALRGPSDDMRMVTTGADGTFDIPDGPQNGAVVAQLGTERSLPAEPTAHVTLQLAPTRLVEGKADIGSRDRTNCFVMTWVGSVSHRFMLMTPIKSDGTFAIATAPVAAIQVGIATRDGLDTGTVEVVDEPAGTTPVHGLALKLTAVERAVDAVVRSETSTPFDNAQVVIMPGHVEVKTVRDINMRPHASTKIQWARQVTGEAAGQQVMAVLHGGDLVAHFTNAPEGPLTVCAIGINGDLRDPKLASQLEAHADQLALKCEFVAADGKLVVIEAPPQKRLD